MNGIKNANAAKDFVARPTVSSYFLYPSTPDVSAPVNATTASTPSDKPLAKLVLRRLRSLFASASAFALLPAC